MKIKKEKQSVHSMWWYHRSSSPTGPLPKKEMNGNKDKAKKENEKEKEDEDNEDEDIWYHHILGFPCQLGRPRS